MYDRDRIFIIETLIPMLIQCKMQLHPNDGCIEICAGAHLNEFLKNKKSILRGLRHLMILGKMACVLCNLTDVDRTTKLT